MATSAAAIVDHVISSAELAGSVVLVVDDVEANVLLLQRLLRRAGVGRVVGSTDARRTIEQYHAIAPDLILLDLHMPHLDGIELLQALAGVIPPDSFTPIVVLTADNAEDTKRRALAAGANDFVTKPFEQSEVLLRVKSLLHTRALHVALQRHNARLNEDLRRAQEMESLGRLAAGIAHEINTPTQFIADNLTFLSDMWNGVDGLIRESRKAIALLRSGTSPEYVAALLDAAIATGDLDYAQAEVPSALAQSQEGTRRVATIVGAMKAFGHPDHDHPEPTDINQMICNTITVANNEIKHVADITTDFAAMPLVSCYRSALSQVVLNLLVNAGHAVGDVIAATGDRGRIGIQTAVDGGTVHIAVTDSGPGIPPDVLPNIFQPFFTTKPVGQGTGQGLALAWATVVERHHGAIDVATSPRGTTFTIRIPLADQASPSVV